jgi:peptidoglycan-associated lipoprotein
MLKKNLFLLASSLFVLASCGGCKKKMISASDVSSATEMQFSQAVPDKVWFDFDSSDISAQSKVNLEKQAQWMKAHVNNRHYVIEGHCDERGTREYNLALGERRANAAVKYLASQGVEAKHLKTVSFGKEKPLVAGHDENAWAQNRRAVTVVCNEH